MPVRRIAEEPASRLAIWARRLAVFSLPVVMLAIIIERAGLLEIVPVLATFAAALALAVIAILLALVALVSDLAARHRGPGRGHDRASLIGLALLAYPAYLGVKAYRLPAISDITTDPIDPPRFETIGRLRSRDRQPDRLCGPLRGRAAEGRLSGHRAARDHVERAGRLRGRHGRHHQARAGR